MATLTPTKKNYLDLFGSSYTSKPIDLTEKLRACKRKSTLDITLYLFDYFSTQFKDKAIFTLDQIKEKLKYSENTVKEALDEIIKNNILLINEVHTRTFLIMINKLENIEYSKALKTGEVMIKSFFLLEEKKGLLEKICNQVKKFLPAVKNNQSEENKNHSTDKNNQSEENKNHSTDKNNQSEENKNHSTDKNNQSEENNKTPESIINTSEQENKNNNIDLNSLNINSLNSNNLDLNQHHTQTETKNDSLTCSDVDNNINKEQEEIRKALKEGLKENTVTEEKKPVKPKANLKPLDSEQVKEILENALFKGEKIRLSEGAIYKFSQSKKKVTPEHAEACIKLLNTKDKDEIGNPAGYLVELLKDPKNSEKIIKTETKVKEANYKEKLFTKILRTLTGKNDLIASNYEPSFTYELNQHLEKMINSNIELAKEKYQEIKAFYTDIDNFAYARYKNILLGGC